MYQIIDNLLEKDQLNLIKTTMLSGDFGWFFNKVANANSKDTNFSSYFIHTFYKNDNGYGEVNSPYFNIIKPILKHLEFKSIIRIKGNLFPNVGKKYVHGFHVDQHYKHKGAIFYLNTNNGETLLPDNVKIDSVENRLLLFDSSLSHSSVSCTNDKIRVNINFNYL